MFEIPEKRKKKCKRRRRGLRKDFVSGIVGWKRPVHARHKVGTYNDQKFGKYYAMLKVFLNQEIG